jgi:hypothetical protein
MHKCVLLEELQYHDKSDVSFDDHSEDGSNRELCKNLQHAFDDLRMAQKASHAQ